MTVETHRRCNACDAIKPIDDFEPAKRYRGGRMPRCRECRAAYRRDLHARAKVVASDARQCTKCKEWRNAGYFVRDRRSRDGLSSQCVDCRRDSRALQDPRQAKDRWMRWKHGITVDEYEERLARQDGKCAICGTGGKLHLDHDHRTGRLRGFLCPPCNTTLGLLKEDPIRMMRMVRYAMEWCMVHGEAELKSLRAENAGLRAERENLRTS